MRSLLHRIFRASCLAVNFPCEVLHYMLNALPRQRTSIHHIHKSHGTLISQKPAATAADKYGTSKAHNWVGIFCQTQVHLFCQPDNKSHSTKTTTAGLDILHWQDVHHVYMVPFWSVFLCVLTEERAQQQIVTTKQRSLFTFCCVLPTTVSALVTHILNHRMLLCSPLFQPPGVALHM